MAQFDEQLFEHRLEEVEKTLDRVVTDSMNTNKAVAVLSTDVKHLTQSLDALSKALWGIAGAVCVALFGFVLWFIQQPQ